VTFSIASTAFLQNEHIPSIYTCDGDNISAPLAWKDISPKAKSLALIVDDPDAPDPAFPKMTWVHWVLYNLPIESEGLSEGVSVEALPPGTKEGINDWRRTGYGGPCPPIGRHRYFFKLYALDEILPDLQEPTKAELQQAMRGHILEKAELIGTYESFN
jgi:Raf kinase inhibitor-like YbhB/YbcL family protein